MANTPNHINGIPVSIGGVSEVSGSAVMDDLRWLLPEMETAVKCPAAVSDDHVQSVAYNSDGYGAWLEVEARRCWHGHSGTISYMIQHLNDHSQWTREQIADWLETLDADLTFPIEPPERPQRQSSRPSWHTFHQWYEDTGTVEFKYSEDPHVGSISLDLQSGQLSVWEGKVWKLVAPMTSFKYAAVDAALAMKMFGLSFLTVVDEVPEPEPKPIPWLDVNASVCPSAVELPIYDALLHTAEIPHTTLGDPVVMPPYESTLVIPSHSPQAYTALNKEKKHGRKHAA